MKMNKILAASFVLGALAFSQANAQQAKTKPEAKTQQKVVKSEKDFNTKFFEEIDSDKDGFISKKEYKKSLEKRFEELDKNKDKVLTKDEFVIKEKCECDKTKASKKTDKECECDCDCPFRGEKAFAELDENNNGKVTKREFVKAKMQNFEKMDADKDGKISKVEFKAFHEVKTKEMKKKVEVKKVETKQVVETKKADTTKEVKTPAKNVKK